MSSKMTAEEIRDGIARLGPFFHNVELPYGLRTWDPETAQRPLERVRVADLRSLVWPLVLERFGGFENLRVLDVACNAGGFSVEAARSGAAEVVGIDIVDRYLEQARFLQSALDLDQVSFRKMRIEELSPDREGTFDVVFCFDVLYHLENPILALRSLTGVTRGLLVLETRVTDRPEWRDHPLWLMTRLPPFEEGTIAMATGRWRTSEMCQLVPAPRSVTTVLDFLGFDEIRQIEIEDPIYPHPDEVQALFTAVRSGP
ncbi:MAG: methyltransferase domain-containing protein [Thermoanaerobaculia bacterium]|nr:methyltransferase domain-containing protein [Thermoanaerobaculia bacterium]